CSTGRSRTSFGGRGPAAGSRPHTDRRRAERCSAPFALSELRIALGSERRRGHMPVYRSILVPLDGSALAERALAVASALASRFGSDLHIVHVLSKRVT